MNSSSRSWKPSFSSSSLLFNMASVKRSMLNTMSSFLVRAQARMFRASSILVAKIVAAMPNWKFAYSSDSACIASIVSQALSKPRLTWRTWSWMSPMPSSETRALMSRSCSAQNLTICVSIGMARWGVKPVVLMPTFRIRGRWRWNISTSCGRSLRVVGSPPEMFRFSTAPQKGWLIAGSSSASVMSDLRSPCFQLLHISHWASHTHVQL